MEMGFITVICTEKSQKTRLGEKRLRGKTFYFQPKSQQFSERYLTATQRFLRTWFCIIHFVVFHLRVSD